MNECIAAQQHQKARQDIPSLRGGLLQRKCACGQHSDSECDECKKKRVNLQRRSIAPFSGQREGRAEVRAAPAIVDNVLRSPGQPLDPTTRAYMEPRFGHDFSQVRIHTGAKAAESARAVNALAYTVGQNIVFGTERYAPETAPGRRLLAHELTHTIQQTQGNAGSMQMVPALKVNDPGDCYEREAEAQADRVTGGHEITPAAVRSRPATGLLQRQADINQAPASLLAGPCNLTAGPGHMAGTDVFFGQSAAAISGGQHASVVAFFNSWVAAGSKDNVIVDGWASVDGPQDVNWQLSCDRAEAVKADLVAQGIPEAKITTFAHGETTEFSTTSADPNRRAIITFEPVPVTPPAPPPGPAPAPPAPPAPAAAITSETVAVSPAPRNRAKIGVGEEVNLTHSGGSVTWFTSAGTLSATSGATVKLTAPDTAQNVIVTGGGARIAFEVIAPTGVHMDRAAGTGVSHTKDHADSGIRTKPFLLPDTVNFLNVIYREMNVGAAATTPGPYSCFPATTGHCAQPAGGACPDLFMTDTVVAAKGTEARLDDCVYSGDCQQAPPFVAGSIVFDIPYEYKVGTGAFRQFVIVHQESNLAADATTLTSSKAGASGTTTVPDATVRIPGCRP